MALNFANNNSLSAITTQPSGLSGSAMTLLSTQTASSSSTIDFTSGIDSTYDEYVFKFINIHPSSNPAIISFQATTEGTNFNTTITSTYFRAFHNESGSSSALQYASGFDQAQGTGFQNLDSGSGNYNDKGSCGTLQIFNPSSTTFVKHFLSQVVNINDGDFTHNVFTAGYFNTTSAITGIRFQMDSGNIDSGVIKLYGIS